jgi:hypothetical protein
MIDVECRKEALEYPMECLSEEVKEIWGRCQAKGETALDVGGIVPLEGKEMLVVLGNRDYSEGVFDIPLDNYAA